MTRSNHQTALAIAVGAVLSAAMLGIDSGNAVAGITNTKHNLGSTAPTSGSRNNYTVAGAGGTTEICVFCHTPHGADTDEPAAPLWNKTIPDAAGFTMYGGSATYDADDATTTTNQPGGVSLACLSCHDGTQAIDSMINAPGSGWGVSDGTAAVTQNYTWFNTTTETLNTNDQLAAGAATNIGGGTASLSNDHPISMAYAGGLVPAATDWTSQASYRDDGFVALQRVGATDSYYVDGNGGTASSRDKQDMILYYYNSQPQVECATCHDPHTENQLFLRPTNANAGSQVCLTCHIK